MSKTCFLYPMYDKIPFFCPFTLLKRLSEEPSFPKLLSGIRIVLFLLFFVSVNLYAQTEEPTSLPENMISDTVEESGTPITQASPETSWIFIPVDGTGTPTGGQYYLPLEMFRKMYQSPTARREEGNRYFFRSAIYTGMISASLTSRDLLVDTIRAVYEVDVRQPETKIRFPFRSAQVYLSPGSTLLNGEPIQTFSENGGPVVNIARPGRYVLEFTLIPIVAPQETRNSTTLRTGRNSE
ncbi:MAG: hypothetical protein Q4C70_14800, partial [Planctomycetia bacterium]|nr:hypothetical protein [Planctomycetia bacterium]